MQLVVARTIAFLVPIWEDKSNRSWIQGIKVHKSVLSFKYLSFKEIKPLDEQIRMQTNIKLRHDDNLHDHILQD